MEKGRRGEGKRGGGESCWCCFPAVWACASFTPRKGGLIGRQAQALMADIA